MASVQNAEIEYNLSPYEEMGLSVRDFWNSFQKEFPSAKKVVFNRIRDYLNDMPVDPRGLKTLVGACPAEVGVMVNFIADELSEGYKRTIPPVAKDCHKMLCRLADGEWQRVETSGSERKRVIMPPKKFHGLADQAEEASFRHEMIEMQQRDLGALMIEALDRHHFDREDPEPFSCPVPGCNFYCAKAGQWTQHVPEAHRFDLLSNEQVFDNEALLNFLTETLRPRFEQRKTQLRRETNELRTWLQRCYRDLPLRT